MTQVPAADPSGRHDRGYPPTDTSAGSSSRWPADISFAVAVGCGAPAALLAWLIGAGVHPVAGLVLFAAVAAALAAVANGLGALGAVLTMWATDDGFVIHRFGVLSLDRSSVTTFAVIGCAAVCGYTAAGFIRWVRRGFHRQDFEAGDPRGGPA